jgi:hypothetical protein
MDRAAVLAKTPKGAAELKSRAHGLAQKLRALLIMIDGVSTAGDLIVKFGGIPDVEAGLQALADQGYVEVRGTAPAPASAGAQRTVAAVQAAPAAAPPQTRKEAMSALTRMLHDAIGPDADMLTGRLEKARTRAEFNAAVERCTDTLEALAGEARAQAFGARAAAFADQHFGGA